jgi:hypothetical protein
MTWAIAFACLAALAFSAAPIAAGHIARLITESIKRKRP